MGKRKNQNQPKPRQHAATFSSKENSKVTGLRVYPNGTAELIDPNGTVIPLAQSAFEVTYARDNEKKPRKVTLLAPISGNRLAINLDAILQKYRYILAVDTNSRIVNDEEISVSCIIVCEQSEALDGIMYKAGPAIAFEWHGVHCDAERLGWLYATQWLCQYGTPTKENAVAMIVDSHLGALSFINSREQPLIGDLYLRAGFDLLYASDAAIDSLPNKLIRMAEKGASEVLGKLARGETITPLVPTPPLTGFSSMRTWNPS